MLVPSNKPLIKEEDIMEFIIFGLLAAFNFGIILSKLSKHQYINALIDFVVMAIICILFSGSFAALATGMTASAAFSLYLIWKKPTLTSIIGKPAKVTSNTYNDFDDDDDF